MRLHGPKERRVLSLIILCLGLWALSGCSVVGPRSISMGRADYNEAINRTEDEQMLLSIVKGRYLTLLGLPMPVEESKDIILPIYFGVKGEGLDGIAISTRSTFDLIEILRAAVEIPQEHAGAGGVARNYPPPGLAGKNIHIHASESRPKRAVLAVKHRGYWFYIDDTDMRTKLFYHLVRTL